MDNDGMEYKNFLITWVTYNVRRSERMKTLKINLGTPTYLSDEDEVLIMGYLRDVIVEDQLMVYEINICRDHVHIVMRCDQNNRDRIVQKLKAVSSRRYNIQKGTTMPGLDVYPISQQGSMLPCSRVARGSDTQSGYCWCGEQSDVTMPGLDVYPISQQGSMLPCSHEARRGIAQSVLWAQKYDYRYLDTDSDLKDAIQYVRYNRFKHNLSMNPKLNKIREDCIYLWIKKSDDFRP